MHWRTVSLVLAIFANAMAQSTAPPNLPGVLSVVQSLASDLDTSSSTSSSSRSSSSSSRSTSSSSITSASSSSITSATSSNSLSSAAAAATSSAPSSDASNGASGLDPRTRNIILGVVIPVGLILLALLIVLLLVCCRRRRRRATRVASPESKYANNKDWEHGDVAHHGYNSSSSLRTGHSNTLAHNSNRDSAPLMAATTRHSDHSHGLGHNTVGDSAPLMTATSHHPNHNNGLGHNALGNSAVLMGAAHHHADSNNGFGHGHATHQDSAPLMAAAHHPTGHNNGTNHNALRDSAPLMAASHQSTGHTNGLGHNAVRDSAPLMMGATHHAGHGKGMGHNTHQDTTPFMGTTHHHAGPEMSEHPAHRAIDGEESTTQNPFAPAVPISRKPVPGRNSTGSNISGISSNHHNSHSSHPGLAAGAAAAGAGVLAGAAVAHHHDKHRRSDASQNGPDARHRPLGSHPHDPSMYTTAGPTDNFTPFQGQRRTSNPFSPDDVGSAHRSSNNYSPGYGGPVLAAASNRSSNRYSQFYDEPAMIDASRRSSSRHSQGYEEPTVAGASNRSSRRYSQGPNEPVIATHQSPANGQSGIMAPTQAQRRSLQSRNSSYSDGRNTPRGPSRSPRRRSLSGGGEMWQAEAESPPALPTSHRYSGDGQFNKAVTPPALPSNRHLNRAQQAHIYDNGNSSNTDSSTSNDSWESAQAELNPWDDRDTGRYPRFSGGSTGNSIGPLTPPSAAWDGRQERRWSGDIFNRDSGDSGRFVPPEVRRNSGGNEKRRLRFSEGQPEIYNEQGLVGRAL